MIQTAAQGAARAGSSQIRVVKNVGGFWWGAGAAAVAAMGAVGCTAFADGDVHVDPATKLQFKSKLPANKDYGAPPMTLLGTGCRYKYGWVQVYAVGVYLDDTGVNFLKSTTTEKSAALAQSKEFFSGLTESAQPRTLTITMQRTVDTPTMVQALEDALRDRVESRQPGQQAPRHALLQFSQMITAAAGAELKAGTEVTFIAISHPGSPETLLHMQLNGKGIGCVRSGAVTWALFDTYLGPASVAPELKTAIAKFFGQN